MTADLPAGGWKGDPKAFLGVVGELLQEPVQPRSRNMQGRRLVLPVICSVTSSAGSLIPLSYSVIRAAQMFSIS